MKVTDNNMFIHNDVLFFGGFHLPGDFTLSLTLVETVIYNSLQSLFTHLYRPNISISTRLAWRGTVCHLLCATTYLFRQWRIPSGAVVAFLWFWRRLQISRLTYLLITQRTIKRHWHLRRCIVKAPHCAALAWKLPFSTWRYRVLTVCERSRLNRATFVPDAMHTAVTHDTAYQRHSRVKRHCGLSKPAVNYTQMTKY